VSQSHHHQVDFSLSKIHLAPRSETATTTAEPLYWEPRLFGTDR
jgi:hypothetical protein